MMAPQTPLFSSSSLFILLLQHFFQTCHANSCIPSACGTIRNISSPFRLKNNPKGCGYPVFELACENNVTSLYLSSHKFYVKEINYLNSTSIRLVDASINNDICSFPNSSAYAINFTNYSYPQYPYYLYPYDLARPINFISCPHPLKNSSLFTDISHCVTSNSDSSHPRFGYVKVGHMNASDLTDMCSVNVIAMTSWEFTDLNNVSLSEIHRSLLYGFELAICDWCGIHPPSNWFKKGRWEKLKDFFLNRFLLIFVVIVGLVCAGVSPPAMAIFVSGAVLLLIVDSIWFFYQVIHNYQNQYSQLDICIGALCIEDIFILAPRVLIFPFALWFLIYKFRRRHLSAYKSIENFLQNDDKLMPIRYSYSDIKRITRGFQDKLGEGGYGSVYKGKLRSGNDVAVKLLKNSRANGQDFMNEIATIGRIHHVNIIKLVGYCAKHSKCALVFDFMSNGSLEKYIFNPENLNSLNWDTRFDIAIGVARGIEYLHRGCDVQILHFDIKPHNILLDEKFIPKISDFGLAKFCSTQKNTMTLTAARGTIGYVAPELINRSFGKVSHKVDVYSFGMMLMEMVNLQRNLRGNNDGSSKYFPYWIHECLNQGQDIAIGEVDENDDTTGKLVRKMTIVALWCIQMSPDDRPSMDKVLEMLEGDLERLQVPEYPSQSTQILINEDQMGTTCSTDSVSLLHHDDGLPHEEITVEG